MAAFFRPIQFERCRRFERAALTLVLYQLGPFHSPDKRAGEYCCKRGSRQSDGRTPWTALLSKTELTQKWPRDSDLKYIGTIIRKSSHEGEVF